MPPQIGGIKNIWPTERVDEEQVLIAWRSLQGNIVGLECCGKLCPGGGVKGVFDGENRSNLIPKSSHIISLSLQIHGSEPRNIPARGLAVDFPNEGLVD